jgi:hypothetical protein
MQATSLDSKQPGEIGSEILESIRQDLCKLERCLHSATTPPARHLLKQCGMNACSGFGVCRRTRLIEVGSVRALELRETKAGEAVR